MLDWTFKHRQTQDQRDGTGDAGAVRRGGLVAGTLVATEKGWIPVEQVCAGDEVMTFDEGPQMVTAVTRRLFPMPAGAGRTDSGVQPLLSLPAGSVGNRRPMLLPEDQAMMIESDLAEAILGDPFALVLAAELNGLRSVRRILPEDRVVLVSLSFDRDQVIFVEGHALAHCHEAEQGAPKSIEEAIWPEMGLRYPILSGPDAELVVAGMEPDSA